MRSEQGTSGWDLLVFDLDGTLIDSQQDLANSVNATLASLGRTGLTTERISGYIGDGAATLLRRALEVTGTALDHEVAEALAYFLAYYQEHKLDCTIAYPGVVSTLEGIRRIAPALPMAVLTNKPVRPSRSICEALGLANFFFAVYGGNSFPTKKPDPQGLHTLIAEAALLTGKAITPERTVLIGDSCVDVQTAQAARIRSIGCTYGLDPLRIRSAGADCLVNHPAEWLQALSMLAQASAGATTLSR